MVVHDMIKSFLHACHGPNQLQIVYNQNAMDIMKQPLHPRVWAWLELAIEAGVDGQGPIFASAKWATETSSSHLVQSALPRVDMMVIRHWSKRVAGQIQVGIMWIKKKKR